MLRLGRLCLTVLILGGIGWAAEQLSGPGPGDPQLVVFVYNDASVPTHLVTDAEKEASRIFRRISVEVTWINCLLRHSQDTASVAPVSSTRLFVRIAPRAVKRSDAIFGVAFLGSDGNGRYADVFFDCVRRLRAEEADVSEARVLAYVMAHEIGHLLLGSNAHSEVGIMEPRWYAAELRNIEMGRLAFTRTECEKIYRRLEKEAQQAHNPITLATRRFLE